MWEILAWIFGRSSIKRRVMVTIKKRIDEAQKAHDANDRRIKAGHRAEMVRLKKKLVRDREMSVEAHVESIIGKFI